MSSAVVPMGSVRPGFERVADAFAVAFEGRPQMGASLCVYVDGEPAIDLWGGIADARSGAPWDAHTLSVAFSCTKGLMSLLCARLVEDGRLRYDETVARWWPEFAAAGKHGILVSDLLSHRAGLSAPRERLKIEDILDWDRVVAALAAQEPLWPAGSGHVYHTITHGWLVGEVIRRVTGKSVGSAFAEMIARPLDAAAYLGLPRSEHRRMAHMQASETQVQLAELQTAKGEDWLLRAATLGDALPLTLVDPEGGFNDPRLWSAEIPGAGGIAEARAMARIWSATVCDTGGVRLLRPETVAEATRTQSAGKPVFDVPPPWSAWGMGFQLDSEARHYLTPAGFGHDGAGGQVAFAEPGLRVGFAYLTNWMEGAGDPRATSVIDALRKVVVP